VWRRQSCRRDERPELVARCGIRPYLGMSDAGRGAVKGAISLPSGVFGMPVKEQSPKLVARAMKGEL